jgi:hypothetical protein
MEVRGQRSALCPTCFNPRKRVPSAHCMGGGVGPRVSPGAEEKRKISCPYLESNPDSLAIQPTYVSRIIRTYIGKIMSKNINSIYIIYTIYKYDTET